MNDVEDNNSISINKIIIDNSFLNNIFKISKEKSLLIPLLNINCGKELKNIFVKPKENIENIEFNSLISLLYNKIKIITEIKKIISNKYETMHIINNYLLKNNISIFKNYIDLYLQFLFSKNKKNNNILDNNASTSENIIKNFQEIFIWFINLGLLNKDIIDYVFQKIAKMQLEQTLTIDSFNIYLSLIEILYGKNNLNWKKDYIAKNYIYLFNKDTSIIKTNVSPLNQINITNGFCIIMWFYFYEYCNENEKNKGILCQIMSKDLAIIDIILSNDYDIDIKYNSNDNLLKESKGHKFKLKSNLWTQVKIQFTDNTIRLFLLQSNDINLEMKYDIKEYFINYEDKNNDNNYFINKIENLKCNNFKISYLNFFLGYEGLIGTIIFCNNSNNNIDNNNNNNEKIILNSISGLQNNKVKDFIKKINLKDIYFIIAPSLYCEEENKFMETTNDINAELSFEEKENNLNLNSVLKIKNYINNIFHLGGCNNLLPLFEILYKFCCELDNKKNENNSNDNDNKINNILKNLFQLLEVIFINKKKNYIESYKNSYHFFESLQLFLENIDEKYFNYDNYNKNKNSKEKINDNFLLTSLINIGKYFYEIKKNNILETGEHHGFFTNILFYPSILMKFSSIQQNFIFSFFDIIKKDNKFFNDYKSYFISFDKISKLLILLSEKNKDEYIPSNLFNIIRNIFEDINTTDGDRETLFLLYNNHLINDKIFINIMEIFIIYFDINTNINSIKYFLYSSNFFIENLLKILLSNNLIVKKLVINFLRVLTNKYNSIFEEYFSFVNECNKKYKNKRINKKDFFIL